MPSDRRLSFLSTLRLLLGTARTRSLGRTRRQRELWQQKSGKKEADWGCLAPVLMSLLTVFLHVFMAYSMNEMVEHSQVLDAERRGTIAVRDFQYRNLVDQEAGYNAKREEIRAMERQIEKIRQEMADAGRREDPALRTGGREAGHEELEWRLEEYIRQRKNLESALRETMKWNADSWFSMVSSDYSLRHGVTRGAAEVALRRHWERFGKDGFAPEGTILGSALMPSAGAMTLLLVVLMVLWWCAMMACQGEGMEMDFQRRRHPMWEWLLGHPVAPGAVILAEMLAPLAANPIYWTAPLFWGVVYGNLHGPLTGLAAVFLIGVPVTMALACVGKALEVWALLRLSMRTRGVVLGLLGWIGYATMIGGFLLPQMKGVSLAILRWLQPVAEGHSWSWVKGMLGFDPAGNPSLWRALAVYLPASAGVAAVAVAFAVWATRKGLAGGFGNEPVPGGKWLDSTVSSLGGDPLFRKELLWFKRDCGAVIQVILIPVTMAAFQLFQFRAAFEHVLEAWHWICGVAVLFGTYFLFILGPRSLVSEGPALWLAWTWPRGMEDLLKAKARLWWMLSSGMVGMILAGALWLFPSDWWKIALVAVGWFYFSFSLAQKTVTLVGKPSDSGETERVPAGRRWAASLGTFSFAIGIITQEWTLAFTGLVFSWITAAAMWQNFRARLPFLYDPWSEKLPPPPTLMHAMVAISAMLEVMAVMTAVFVVWLGPGHMQAARTICYAITGLITFIWMTRWLEDRGVDRSAVWTWGDAGEKSAMGWSGVALVAGLVLGGVALIYTAVLMWFPGLSSPLVEMRQQLAANPAQRWWLAGLAVVCAPVAEEYLFRGLLYRALDREWGGWAAVLGSAGFFAIFHPPIAWLPVSAVGVACALLFKLSPRLWPCVVLHTVYNAVVVYWT